MERKSARLWDASGRSQTGRKSLHRQRLLDVSPWRSGEQPFHKHWCRVEAPGTAF